MNAWQKLVARLSRRFHYERSADNTRPVDSRTILNRIVAQTLQTNLIFMTGKSIAVAVRHGGYQDLEREITRFRAGYLVTALGESGGRRSALLLPPDMVAFLVETILRTHGATVPDEGLALVRCLEWLDGNLSRLGFIDDTSEEPHLREFHRVVIPITGDPTTGDPTTGDPTTDDGLGSVLWHASDSALVSFTFEGFAGYLMFDVEVHRRLLRSLQREKFRRAARSLVLTEFLPDAPSTGSGASKDEERDIHFTIDRSHEFTLGRLFIPDTFGTGGRTFHTVYEHVVLPRNYREWMESPVLSRTVTLEISGESFPLVYTVAEPELEELLEVIGTPDSFYQALLTRGLANLQAIVGESRIGRARYVTEQTVVHPMDLEEPIVLAARVHTPATTLQMVVFLPRALINILCEAILSPLEILYLQRSGRNALVSILSLNEVLFHRGFSDLLPGSVRNASELRESGITVPFHDLVEHFGKADLKVITQNFLLPRLGEDCVRLFNVQAAFVEYGDADETGRREKLTTYRPVLHRNFRRIKPYLPDSFQREEAILLRKYAGLGRFEHFNYSVMTELHRAIAEDRLVVSPRVRYVMRVLFLDRDDETAEAAIRDYARRRAPFGELAELLRKDGPRAGRQVVDRCDNRTLALACLGTGYAPEALAHLMSRGRREDFASDYRFLRAEKEAGKIGAGEILECLRTVEARVRAS